MSAQIKKIWQYLEAHSGEMESFLQELVRVESPSKDPKAQDPLFDILIQAFQEISYTALRMPGQKTGGFALFKPQDRIKRDPLQLLIGHCDTVWDQGTLQHMPIERSSGQLKGPGVYDMKAGLTQMVFALKGIQALNLPLELTPVCLINSDEEIGSKESTTSIRRLAKIAERAYILEPPLGLEGKLKTARKGLGRFTLTVTGKAAHAGLNPGEGVSAILELSHQIQELFSFNDPQRGISINVGMVEGGISPNVIAPVGKAVADVRAPTQKDAAFITEKILSLRPVDPGVSLKIEGGFGRMPMEKTHRNSILWEAAQTSAKRLAIELEDASAGGGSDANTTSLYTATLDGLGTVGDGAHAQHEFIFLDKLKERTALLILLLLLPSLVHSHPSS